MNYNQTGLTTQQRLTKHISSLRIVGGGTPESIHKRRLDIWEMHTVYMNE